MSPVIALLLLDEDRFKDTLAAGAVCGAALTDFLDGFLARKQGKETKLGQFLDPLADKIYISSSFAILSKRGRIPAWIPGVIIGRELLITAFRLYAGSRGSSVPASMWGKLKTNSQLLALLLVILDRERALSSRMETTVVTLAVALTLYSGLDYLLKAGRYIQASEGD